MQIMAKSIKRYNRRCRKCGKIYNTPSRRSKICPDCKTGWLARKSKLYKDGDRRKSSMVERKSN